MKCGLLGRKLAHSYSPAIHGHLGDYAYGLFEKEPEELHDFLRHGDWDGINVTMPYKQDVIPYLEELTPIAEALGAVNTIVRRNGRLIGHNTDYFGFRAMVEKSGLSPTGKKCLVLGSGGASKGAVAVLKAMGAQVVVISRTGEHHYQNLYLHKDASILVNTTPVGMYPNTMVAPVQIHKFPQLEGVLDVVYNPARTKLLMDAEACGLVAMNGLWMLVAQAKEAAEYFSGASIPEEAIEKIHGLLHRQMENIVLIGMPGCGKSTIGKRLAEAMGKHFVDADAEIENRAKKFIPQIFAEDGESVFRDFESQVLAEFGKASGLVIATGGGCVTRAENEALLRQNGLLIWLQRDIDRLPTEGRPLSNNLSALYAARKPIYESFADLVIQNNGTIDAAVKAILEVFP